MLPTNITDRSMENSSTKVEEMLKDITNSPNNDSEESQQELQTFCQSFSKMKITPQQVAKVTKERIYSVAVHPSREKVLVCGGDKGGRLGMWDVVSPWYKRGKKFKRENWISFGTCVNAVGGGGILIIRYGGELLYLQIWHNHSVWFVQLIDAVCFPCAT